MKKIDNENLYYRDKFLEDNEQDIPVAVDFSLDTLNELLAKYNNHCTFAEHFYCCNGLENRCWTEIYFVGNWNMTQDQIVSDLRRSIGNILPNISGQGRVYIDERTTYTNLFVFARDLKGWDYDLVISFGNEDIF